MINLIKEIFSFPIRLAIVTGKAMMDDAKMTGTTPPVQSLIGIVPSPPPVLFEYTILICFSHPLIK